MDTIGWIGLGKLGLTCALTLEQHAGVDIVGFDMSPDVRQILNRDIPPPSNEAGLDELLNATEIHLAEDYTEVVRRSDGIVFVSVQTPHAPEFGGEQPMPETRQDFDYGYLAHAVEQVSAAADTLGKDITLVVISTCLPGTCRRVLLPILSDRVSLVYNPFFIAMGTTVRDFLNPEFVLIGTDAPADARPLVELYDRLYEREVETRVMSLESAELTKVAYNTFISMKIVFANTLMEICEATGADVDSVTDALSQATDRIISPAYMAAGMGDGGACHPRDNIAMSWLAKAAGLSADPFEFVTRAREAQTNWLARFIELKHDNVEVPIILLGKAYKPGSDLTYGSPALLLAHMLEGRGVEFEHYDHNVDYVPLASFGDVDPAIYVVATKHPEYETYLRPAPGSVIIDPFRYIPDQEGVEIVRLGEGY